MSRIARVVVPGLPHHVTQRGNGRQATFLSDEDRLVYLDLLRGHRRQYGLRIWAYCLMNNHIHLLAVPEGEDSLAHTLGRTHADYARYWNARRRSCGHVWQARFYSCPLEDDQIWTVARYVEMNPVRAGLVEEAERWPWSSAQAHLVERDVSGLLELSFWASQYDGARWSRVLRSGVEDEAWQQRLVESTLSGRPLGSETFIDRLERQLGASLRPKPPGRPPKSRAQAVAASG
jgi:putative transposase